MIFGDNDLDLSFQEIIHDVIEQRQITLSVWHRCEDFLIADRPLALSLVEDLSSDVFVVQFTYHYHKRSHIQPCSQPKARRNLHIADSARNVTLFYIMAQNYVIGTGLD